MNIKIFLLKKQCFKFLIIKLLIVLSYLGMNDLKGQTFNQTELKLKDFFDSLSVEKNDTFKLMYCDSIENVLNTVLVSNESFTFPFDQLKYLGKITADDNLLRVYIWNITFNDGTFKYFGFIQYKLKVKKEYKMLTFKLNDKSLEIKRPETFVGNHEEWFGVLYYQIVVKTFGKKTYYTMLGWDGADDLINTKIIEILTFNALGEPTFGASIFELGNESPKRILFHFGNQQKMSLLYEKNNDRIVYDHLSPSKPEYEGMYQYYGADFSYDALHFEKGKWKYRPAIDARNSKTKFDLYKRNKN